MDAPPSGRSCECKFTHLSVIWPIRSRFCYNVFICFLAAPNKKHVKLTATKPRVLQELFTVFTAENPRKLMCRGPRPSTAAQQEPAGVTSTGSACEGAAVLGVEAQCNGRTGLELNGNHGNSHHFPHHVHHFSSIFRKYCGKSTLFINHGESCDQFWDR